MAEAETVKVTEAAPVVATPSEENKDVDYMQIFEKAMGSLTDEAERNLFIKQQLQLHKSVDDMNVELEKAKDREVQMKDMHRYTPTLLALLFALFVHLIVVLFSVATLKSRWI